MPKHSMIEQLDKGVQALLTSPDTTPQVDSSLAPLLQIAARLRDLPREEFKARLKRDLQQGRTADSQGVTPYLTFRDASRAIEFYKRVFGAVEHFRLTEPNGKLAHAEIAIGGSVLKLADEYPDYGSRSPESYGGSPIRLHISVADADAVVAEAVKAGAKIIRPVEDQFYGDRTGLIQDPFGYSWVMSTHKEDLSREELQRRFHEMLSQSAAAKRKVNPVPEGFRTVTPYLVVKEAEDLIAFVKDTFGAQERFRSIGPAGGIHCEVKIGDSIMMIGGGGKWRGTPMPTALHVYVPNADEAYEGALRAGAVSMYEPTDQPYGDREGGVRDRSGNLWYIGTNTQTGGAPEGMGSVTSCIHSRDPRAVMDFLKVALGAEDMQISESPAGAFQHAKLKLGTSVMEIGPAHGPYQPMPAMIYLYVEDVDALYQQAIEGGATSISPPADQPYGDRNAGVRDPFGNQWYIATHVKDVS